jgi:hypothetical protein
MSNLPMSDSMRQDIAENIIDVANEIDPCRAADFDNVKKLLFWRVLNCSGLRIMSSCDNTPAFLYYYLFKAG